MLDEVLLKVAKSAILRRFDNSYSFEKHQLLKKYPFLQNKGASFVTLKKSGDLRGCIGSIIAHRVLVDDIIHNANSAAFNDPRFDLLSEDELDNDLVLEISVLSEPKEIKYDDYEDLIEKIVPKKDGLILKHASYQGTFLPQVWDQLPSSKQFLEHLSYKAGANPTIYQHHPQIYRYRVEHIEDRWDAILSL
jgi:AmmeMemoRadiSam system protein A